MGKNTLFSSHMRTVPILAALLGLAAPNGAEAVVLSDLLNGGNITVGDMRFDQWTLLGSSTTVTPFGGGWPRGDVNQDGTINGSDLSLISIARGQVAGPADRRDVDQDGSITVNDVKSAISRCTNPGCVSGAAQQAVDLSKIDVQPLTDGGFDPGPGLRFAATSADAMSVSGSDGVFTFIDLMFGFRVSALDPGLRIKDNSLGLTGGLITPRGDNGFYIRETIGTAAGLDDLGTKAVEFSRLDDQTVHELTDVAEFAPQDAIWVTKNILVWATHTGESVVLTEFTQRFSQIPEPATLALFGLGLAGLGAVRRRKLAA